LRIRKFETNQQWLFVCERFFEITAHSRGQGNTIKTGEFSMNHNKKYIIIKTSVSNHGTSQFL